LNRQEPGHEEDDHRPLQAADTDLLVEPEHEEERYAVLLP
jgi:hypothetical protein